MTKTTNFHLSGAGLRLLRFFFLKIIVHAVLLWEQLFQIFRWLAGNVLNGNTFADAGNNMTTPPVLLCKIRECPLYVRNYVQKKKAREPFNRRTTSTVQK